MTTRLEPTGERVIEDAYHRSLGAYVIYVMHAASYRFAESYCSGKRVIDLGCGSGYGAARIAKVAERIEGIDISGEAIEFAKSRYRATNLAFHCVEPDARLPFADETFDVALSFQVIEHVDDDARYLTEARRILAPGGMLLIITPDRQHRLFSWQRPWNRWHVREHSKHSLSATVARVFTVELALRMGADWSVAGIEHRRYRTLKWLTLPFTLPFLPESIRQWGLNLLHGLRRRAPAVEAEKREQHTPFDFGEEAMIISAEPPWPLNLVLLARK